MMKYPLNSKFSDRITDFVDYKHSLGHSYEESCRILWKFDLFCCDRFPEKSSFDRDIAMAWLEMRDTEGRAGHRNRIMVLREFARYLSAIGDTAYLIPISMTAKSPRYMPHIFTVTEIAAFFYGADHFIPHKDAPARHLVVPVFYRLLYCCGLRPAEARLLRNENVDLVRGVLYIEESKGHKDRIVVLSESMLALCVTYDQRADTIYPDRKYFFQSPSARGDGMYSMEWMIPTFRRFLHSAGIFGYAGVTPRTYDLRHSFATHRLYQWIKEGKDVNACLAYLSEYMGHANLSDTAYYIHLLPTLYTDFPELHLDTLQTEVRS